ncbi:MAG: SDR family NAD(P)-dependent oxidoreductase, partial [Myxococcales bacterium]
VVLADVDERAVFAATERLNAPGRAVAVAVDIAADDAGRTLVSRCVEAFGGVDVLVNNAGIFPQVPMLKTTPELFDRVYRINLRGLAFASQAVARVMVEQGTGGRIINIGSIDSVRPSMVGLAAYDASKGGVLMFTRNFALEMAPHGVTVNVILPGGVTTEGTTRPLEGNGMSVEQAAAMMDQFAEHRVPLKRMGRPEEIAHAALFLASAGSSYMTGASVVVDGGALLV